MPTTQFHIQSKYAFNLHNAILQVEKGAMVAALSTFVASWEAESSTNHDTQCQEERPTGLPATAYSLRDLPIGKASYLSYSSVSSGLRLAEERRGAAGFYVTAYQKFVLAPITAPASESQALSAQRNSQYLLGSKGTIEP